jgi:hypothetical protein
MSKYVPPFLRKQEGAGGGSICGDEEGSSGRRAEASPPPQRQNRDQEYRTRSNNHGGGSSGDQQRHYQHSHSQKYHPQSRDQQRNDRDRDERGYNQQRSHGYEQHNRERGRESATWGRDLNSHDSKSQHNSQHTRRDKDHQHAQFVEKRIYFRSDRGPLLVGKNHRNILEIKNNTRVSSIDVPHGRGVVAIRGPDPSEVEKAVSRCAEKLAAVERKETVSLLSSFSSSPPLFLTSFLFFLFSFFFFLFLFLFLLLQSPEAVIFLYAPPSKTSQRFRFEEVIIESEAQNWDNSSSNNNALYRIRLATPEEVAEEQKQQLEKEKLEKQKRGKEEENDLWKLTFGGGPDASPSPASSSSSTTLPIVEEKHLYLNTHNLVKHIIKAQKNQVLTLPGPHAPLSSIPPPPSSPTSPAADFLELSMSSSFGRCIFLNIPEDKLSKNYSLNELHALLEKERYRFFFRWGVPNEIMEKLQVGLEKEARVGERPRVINSNIKQAGVVIGDHQGNHYKTVQIQKWEEAEGQKAQLPPQPAEQEQTGAKKKKKKKKKTKDAFTVATSHSHSASASSSPAPSPSPSPYLPIPPPPGLSLKTFNPKDLKYHVFNGREMQINVCMIGAAFDTQIIISESSPSNSFEPSEGLLSFISQLKIEEASGKLVTPSASQYIFPPCSSVHILTFIFF